MPAFPISDMEISCSYRYPFTSWVSGKHVLETDCAGTSVGIGGESGTGG